MSNYDYAGFYARFDTPSKAIGSLLLGPDNIVGDEFFTEFKLEDGSVRVWIKNKFGKEVGYFDSDVSRKLQLANARNQIIRIALSFVAYSDTPDPGCYWGQFAVFCYSPSFENEFDSFFVRCSKELSNGVRLNIDLGNQAVQNIISDSTWLPKDTIPLPKKETGFAVLKDHQSLSEKAIEQGRSKNIGCYAISWIFIIAIIVLIVFWIHSLGIF